MEILYLKNFDMENKKTDSGGIIILSFTLAVIAVMYMTAFHSERNKNRELQKQFETYKKNHPIK